MRSADLAVLHTAAFAGLATGRGWTSEELDDLLRDPHVFLCTSRDPGTGFALGRAVAEEAELLTLAVRPDRRRVGIGRQLLSSFEREARVRRAREAFVEVADGNWPAIALYASGGYAERGRRRGYYATAEGGRLDALILARALVG